MPLFPRIEARNMSFNPFPIGTKLHVETCFGEHITGEVVTYEHSVKMLIINCHSRDIKERTCCNVCIVNLAFCKDLKIIHEAKTTIEKLCEPPTRLSLQSLDLRLQQSLVQRESLLRSRNEHATPRGRQLFQLLSQHFGPNELAWQLDKIIVLHQLTIAPPYRMSDITSAQHAPKLLSYVQRLVQKLNLQSATGNKDDVPK